MTPAGLKALAARRLSKDAVESLGAWREALRSGDRSDRRLATAIELTLQWNGEMGDALATAADRIAVFEGKINSPCTTDFLEAVPLEAAHQVERWGAEHDAVKTPLSWFWLIGYLAQKATFAAQTGDREKYRHHIITTGAALLNWFEQVQREDHNKAVERDSHLAL